MTIPAKFSDRIDDPCRYSTRSSHRRLWSLIIVLALGASNVSAFEANASVQLAPPEQAATPAPAAQLSSDLFISNAIAIAQALDSGGAAKLYDAASATMKRSVSKEDFVNAVTAGNAQTGRIAQYEWGRVERLRVDAPVAGAASPAVPAGNYITVFIIARNVQGTSHLEQVSFRLDEDNQWRLSGATTHTPE